MTQPYRFSDPDARVTSPLDRRAPTTLQPSEAPSFKTNVNRNKTRKWVDAKNVAYDGDDWGDYDEDNEYGVEAPQALPAQAGSNNGRNFTAPVPASSLQRSDSFERGDEKRAFSAGVPPAMAHAPVTQPTSHPANRAVSGVSMAPSEASDASVNPEHRRDFTPSAMPPPLHTSRGQSASPAPSLTSPIQRPPSTGAYDPRATSSAALPFIRPADIYKRMEEAKEKQRRASMESNQSAAGSEDSKTSHPGPVSSTTRRSLDKVQDEHVRTGKPPLASVPERKSEYGLLDQPGAEEQLAQVSQPSEDPKDRYQLPEPTLSSSSTFGDDFWNSTPDLSISGTKPLTSKATTPATAVQTLHVPTSDKVPSREPSQGFRSMVHQAFKPSEASMSKQDSTRSLGTNHSQGTSDISPILSPINDEEQASPETPKAGQVETKDLPPPPKLDPPLKDKPLPDPVEPTKAHTPTALASKESEELPPPPKLNSTANSRSSSPSKGRVNDLAAQFNRKDADSRRSSVVSVGSRHSAAEVKTWESPRPQSAEFVRGREPAGDPSPDVTQKLLPTRPKIPGQFDSYAFGATPAIEEPPPIKPDAATFVPPPPPKDEEIPDLSPTTERHQLEAKNVSKSAGAMAALAAAGAAVGAALRGSTDSEEEKKAGGYSSPQYRTHGDVHLSRPLGPDRLESTATQSTMPPTPPAKDDSMEDEILPPPPLKIGATPISTPQKSSVTNDATDDTPKASHQAPKVAERVPSVATDAAVQQLSKEAPPKEVSAAGPVSSANPMAPDAVAAPVPKLSRKFSWETESSLAPSSHLDVRNLVTTPAASPPVQSSSKAPIRQDTVADNSRLTGEGLHVKNAQPGELPAAATDPTANLPSYQAGPNWNDSPYFPASPPKAQHDAGSQGESSSGVPTAAIGAGFGLAAGAAAIGAAAASDKKETLAIANEPSPNIERPATPPLAPATAQPVQPPVATQEQVNHTPPALPSFREIMNMKSADERISTFNSTRKEWASMNSGLDGWLSQTLQKYPEHSTLKAEAAQPYMNASTSDLPVSSSPGGRGHIKAGSLGKIFTSMGGQGGGGYSATEQSPESARQDKRGSGAGLSGAGKAVGNTLKGFGGKGKNLFNKIKSERKKGDDVGH